MLPNRDKLETLWIVRNSGFVDTIKFDDVSYAIRPVVCLPYGVTGTITEGTLNIDAE